MMKKVSSISCALVLSFASLAQAATITEFEFTGNSLAPTTVAPHVTVSNMSTVSTTHTAGSGFINDGAVTPSGNPQYSETGFQDGGYFTFTLQADSGYFLDLANFEFYQRLGSTGTGRTYALEYLINGGTPVQFGTGSANTTTYTLRTAGLAISNEVHSIEFRINGFIPDNNGTTFRIDDVLLSGSVTFIPAPEPATGVLLGTCLLGFMAIRRCKSGKVSKAAVSA